jgi:hypothetical protein
MYILLVCWIRGDLFVWVMLNARSVTIRISLLLVCPSNPPAKLAFENAV